MESTQRARSIFLSSNSASLPHTVFNRPIRKLFRLVAPLRAVAMRSQTKVTYFRAMVASDNMSDSRSLDLTAIPDGICPQWLPFYDHLSSKVHDRSMCFFLEGYVHGVKVYEARNSESSDAVTPGPALGRLGVDIRARCWRSMAKSKTPHQITIMLGDNNIQDASCSCTAG